MALLLTSAGLAEKKIADLFLRLLKKSASKAVIGFVRDAARTKEEWGYVAESEKELLGLGVKSVKVLDLEKPAIDGCDALYVCGGNTFYLMKRVRETSFDAVIKGFVKSGRLYVGVSAGSIIAGPDISVAAPFDDNDCGLTDLKGLCLTEAVVSPHYCEKEEALIAAFEKKARKRVIRLTDKEALLVEGRKRQVV